MPIRARLYVPADFLTQAFTKILRKRFYQHAIFLSKKFRFDRITSVSSVKQGG